MLNEEMDKIIKQSKDLMFESSALLERDQGADTGYYTPKDRGLLMGNILKSQKVILNCIKLKEVE